MDTTRIINLTKQQGKTLVYICKLIGRAGNYLNEVKNKGLTMPEEYRPMGEVVLSTRVNAQADYDMELSALLQQNGNIGTVARKASTNVITFTGTYICRG